MSLVVNDDDLYVQCIVKQVGEDVGIDGSIHETPVVTGNDYLRAKDLGEFVRISGGSSSEVTDDWEHRDLGCVFSYRA